MDNTIFTKPLTDEERQEFINKCSDKIERFYILKKNTNSIKRWLLPSIESFCRELKCLISNLDTEYIYYNLDYLLNSAGFLAKCAKTSDEFGYKETGFFNDIFSLLLKAFSSKPLNIKCLHDICYIITHNRGKARGFLTVFDSCEILCRVVTKIYDDWDDLKERGYCAKVFKDYCDYLFHERATKNSLSAEEKYLKFMDILNGEALFLPVFKKVSVGYTVVKAKETVKITEHLIPSDEEFTKYGLKPKE